MRLRRLAAAAATIALLGGLGTDPAAAQGTTDLTEAAPAAGGFEDYFAISPLTVNGTYLPFLGDFCLGGGQYATILWYAPGPAQDYLWTLLEGEGDSPVVSSTPITINGTYTPVVGDFNGDPCSDVLWYAPGTAADSIWWGSEDGGFSAEPLAINGTYTPILGEYGVPEGDDCEWCDDIFWYSTTGGTESIWLGSSDRTFVPASAPQVSYSDYRVAGTGTGILFHRPGPGADHYWDGVQAGQPAPAATMTVAIDGTYEPYGIGPGGVLLYAPGPATDRIVSFNVGTQTMLVQNGTINGTYRVAVPPATYYYWQMILFHGPGAAPDSLWRGLN